MCVEHNSARILQPSNVDRLLRQAYDDHRNDREVNAINLRQIDREEALPTTGAEPVVQRVAILTLENAYTYNARTAEEHTADEMSADSEETDSDEDDYIITTQAIPIEEEDEDPGSIADFCSMTINEYGWRIYVPLPTPVEHISFAYPHQNAENLNGMQLLQPPASAVLQSEIQLPQIEPARDDEDDYDADSESSGNLVWSPRATIRVDDEEYDAGSESSDNGA